MARPESNCRSPSAKVHMACGNCDHQHKTPTCEGSSLQNRRDDHGLTSTEQVAHHEELENHRAHRALASRSSKEYRTMPLLQKLSVLALAQRGSDLLPHLDS